MRWPVFALFAYVLLVLEHGLRTLFVIGHTSPSFLLILAVFIGLWAPPMTAAWAAMALGILADLGSPLQPAGQSLDVALIGPIALGFVTASYVAVQLRGLVFRESSLAFGVMVFLAGIFAHLVTVAVLTVRGLPWFVAEPVAGWAAADQLVQRFLEVVYSAGVAIPMGYVLQRLHRVWGFPPVSGKAFGHHHGRR